jgi:hypothetical protein
VHYKRFHVGHDIPLMVSDDEIRRLKSIGIWLDINLLFLVIIVK